MLQNGLDGKSLASNTGMHDQERGDILNVKMTVRETPPGCLCHGGGIREPVSVLAHHELAMTPRTPCP